MALKKPKYDGDLIQHSEELLNNKVIYSLEVGHIDRSIYAAIKASTAGQHQRHNHSINFSQLSQVIVYNNFCNSTTTTTTTRLMTSGRWFIKNFAVCLLIIHSALILDLATHHQVEAARMVRLCIASVDPVKLSSQCVMCNRREFPLTVIDCTGMTKVNELISNPLSVQEATCLIYNCRRQVPEVKPEPYHGSVSSAIRANHPLASGSRIYDHSSMAPSAMFGGGGYASSPMITRYSGGIGGGGAGVADASGAYGSALPIGPFAGSIMPAATRGRIRGSNLFASGQQQQMLPYAIVPAPSYPSLFGLGLGPRNKYKAALVPLYK